MKKNRINTIIVASIITLFPILSFATQTPEKGADGTQGIKNRVRKLLKEKDIFRRADETAVFWETTDNEVFYNISRGSLKSMLGEKFVDDEQMLTGEDPWNLDVGKSPSWNYAIDDENERFLLRHRQMIFGDTVPKRKRSRDDIRKSATVMLKNLGIEETKDVDIDIRELRRTAMYEDGKTEDFAIAYKVFVQRKIDSVPIRGSRIVLTYLLDGRLQKMLMKWPAIEDCSIALQKTSTNDEIIERIAQRMEQNDMIQGENLDAEIGFEIHEGRLRMGTIVTALVPGPNNSFFGKEIFVEI